MMYKLYKTTDGLDGIIYNDGNVAKSFLVNPANTDYQAYLKWVAEGNTPLPADNTEA